MGPGGSPGLVLDRCRVRRGSTGVLKQKVCKIFQLDIFGLLDQHSALLSKKPLDKERRAGTSAPDPHSQRGANSMPGQSDIAPDEVPTQYRRTPDTIPTQYRHNTDIVRQHYLKITRQKPGSS